MTTRSRGSFGVVLVLALLVASVPVCPCAPEPGAGEHSCCAPSLALTAAHDDCCPPSPDLTGAQADSPAPARLADAGPAPESVLFGKDHQSRGASAPAPSPPSTLRI